MKDHGMHTFIIVIAYIMYECGIDCGLNCVLGIKWGVYQLDWLRYGIKLFSKMPEVTQLYVYI